MFGNPETTPGGRALKFYSSVRLDVRRSEIIKQGENMLGNRTRVKVVKIRLHLLLNRQNSILYMVKEYQETDVYWILVLKKD